ncbi:MAG TPA: DUF3365 domain-containing protein [Gemmatimonadales bacterium]
MRCLLVLCTGVLAGVACSADRPPSPARQVAAVDSAELARARAAADQLGQDLMGLLTSELDRGGPEAAIAVCADSAQQRTARHSAEGTLVRRVGTRVRNPANRPDSVEAAVLRRFAEALAGGRTPADTAFATVDADGSREVRFLRPIRVAKPCLACHGPPEGFAPGVRALLAERYPDDRAVGYEVGDLRGAVSVRLRDAHQSSATASTSSASRTTSRRSSTSTGEWE